MTDAPAGTGARRLRYADWRAREAAHRLRADALTAGHRSRRGLGERHPVEDFLWTYYSVTPSELRRSHPGAGAILVDGAKDRATWQHYTVTGEYGLDAAVDLPAYFERRGGIVDYIERLLGATLERTPQFGCFGLHKWAMVYRSSAEERRHTRLPARGGMPGCSAASPPGGTRCACGCSRRSSWHDPSRRIPRATRQELLPRAHWDNSS